VFEPEPWTLLVVAVGLFEVGIDDNAEVGVKTSGLGGGRRWELGSDMDVLEGSGREGQQKPQSAMSTEK